MNSTAILKKKETIYFFRPKSLRTHQIKSLAPRKANEKVFFCVKSCRLQNIIVAWAPYIFKYFDSLANI
jgi:hypothetical protein